MNFGPTPPKKVPAQDSSKVLRIAERWQRATWAHTNWAEPAKKCVDMFEGRQYTASQIAEAARQGRPLFKFNVIKPLVNLILGYQRQNKTDITFAPGQDSLSVEKTAEALSRLEKSISQGCELDFIDCEVFLDGLLTGRGWYDTRLDWKDNDLGTIKTKARDPFLVKPDPDADTYDIGESASYITTERYVSVDEIECSFGKKVSQLIKPFVSGNTPLAPLSSFVINDDVVPVRTFGETEGSARPGGISSIRCRAISLTPTARPSGSSSASTRFTSRRTSSSTWRPATPRCCRTIGTRSASRRRCSTARR
jgi:hypothetical protein